MYVNAFNIFEQVVKLYTERIRNLNGMTKLDEDEEKIDNKFLKDIEVEINEYLNFMCRKFNQLAIDLLNQDMTNFSNQILDRQQALLESIKSQPELIIVNLQQLMHTTVNNLSIVYKKIGKSLSA